MPVVGAVLPLKVEGIDTQWHIGRTDGVSSSTLFASRIVAEYRCCCQISLCASKRPQPIEFSLANLPSNAAISLIVIIACGQTGESFKGPCFCFCFCFFFFIIETNFSSSVCDPRCRPVSGLDMQNAHDVRKTLSEPSKFVTVLSLHVISGPTLLRHTTNVVHDLHDLSPERQDTPVLNDNSDERLSFACLDGGPHGSFERVAGRAHRCSPRVFDSFTSRHLFHSFL